MTTTRGQFKPTRSFVILHGGNNKDDTIMVCRCVQRVNRASDDISLKEIKQPSHILRKTSGFFLTLISPFRLVLDSMFHSELCMALHTKKEQGINPLMKRNKHMQLCTMNSLLIFVFNYPLLCGYFKGSMSPKEI